jgi:hypothetical protein
LLIAATGPEALSDIIKAQTKLAHEKKIIIKRHIGRAHQAASRETQEHFIKIFINYREQHPKLLFIFGR